MFEVLEDAIVVQLTSNIKHTLNVSYEAGYNPGNR
jgi:hypothetical protein